MGASKKKKVSAKKQLPPPPPEESSEDEIDYAATADLHASDTEEELSAEDEVMQGSSDDESVEEEQEDNDDMEDDGEDEDEAYHDDQKNRATNNITVPGDEPCTFDLRNLLAVSAHPIDTATLYDSKLKMVTDDTAEATIPQTTTAVNEDYLLQKAEAGCNQIVSALWQLPIERSDVGPMVQLPSYDDSKIPRALAPPPPKAETKWEKFAKEKGIGNNKEKRAAKVWDETEGDWQYRHGYKKSGNDKEWPIMEVKASEDPYADPWERQRDAKRVRTDKNVEQRMRNEERAGGIAKGTSSKMTKSMAASRKAGKLGGGSSLPVGIPADLKASGRKGNSDIEASMEAPQRGKTSTMAALLATQRSTASLGKFDKMREGEPERRKAMQAAKKRQFESATDKKVTSTEAERSLKLLKTLSGGAAKEKDRKKGRLATGETAYDYDFDDGLGASSFKKKKGRAGAGKMKKMTKKRAK